MKGLENLMTTVGSAGERTWVFTAAVALLFVVLAYYIQDRLGRKKAHSDMDLVLRAAQFAAERFVVLLLLMLFLLFSQLFFCKTSQLQLQLQPHVFKTLEQTFA